MAAYAPHGACWLWNPWLIVLHAAGDLFTCLAYLTIPILAIYVYRQGQLNGLGAAYPRLWRRGAAFIFFCGLSHAGAFLEIWYGGGVYWITGANKVVMAVSSLLFAAEFWKVRDDLVLIGRFLERAEKLEAADEALQR